GAVAATLGVILPSFLIILLISFFLDRFLQIRWVASAFRGIKIAVSILIVDAAVKMIRKMKKKPLPVAIISAASSGVIFLNFSLSLQLHSMTTSAMERTSPQKFPVVCFINVPPCFIYFFNASTSVNVCIILSIRIGFARWPSIPAFFAAWTSSAKAFAVIAIIGMDASFGSGKARMALVAS
ncbi:MAG: chromate transporter, partial [Victivallales bacterium]|nr:chromate transporter [Victivallales bacterium]